MTEENISTATAGAACGCAKPEEAAGVGAGEGEEGGKRRGFHPALVAATIFTVIFVLWFCPWALMRARIVANEAAAESVMRSDKFLLLETPSLRERIAASRNRDDLHDLRLVMASYSGLRRDDPRTGRKLFLLRPLHYGRTARLSYCYFAGSVYSKDLGAATGSDAPLVPDDTWTQLK